MPKAQLTADKLDLFERKPVLQSVLLLAIPTIIGQLVMLFHNLADTFFVGKLNDPGMVAGITVSMPATMIINAIVNLFGVGGGSLISRLLGRRELDRARKVCSVSFYMAIAMTMVFSIVCAVFLDEVCILLGSPEQSLEYSRDYLLWIVCIGGIPQMLNVLFGHLVRSVGSARQASVGISLSALVNCLLDPVFILPWGLGLGVEGAAIATVLANLCSCLYFTVLLMRSRQDSVLSLMPSDFKPDRSMIAEIAKIGTPAALQTVLASFSSTILNNMIAKYGHTALAAAGISRRIDMLPSKITLGLSQGVLPLIAYNYAQKNYKRMHQAARITRVISMSFALCCVAAFQIFSRQLVSLFILDEPTVELGTRFLRILCLGTPLMALNYLTTTTFQATGQGPQALAMSVFRKGLADIPLVFLLDRIWPMYGLMGVQLAVDILATALSITLYRMFLKKLRGELGVKVNF